MPIFFTADDFGMQRDINNAIQHAHESGILHGAALMMAQSATNEAISMARDIPSLQMGWHLHLNDSIPSTRQQWPWGASPARAGITISFSRPSRQLMRDEMTRQWELYQETGLPCHFINSHHHLHAHPTVFATLKEIVGSDFTGWIRQGNVRFFRPAFRLLNPARVVDVLFQRERRLSPWRSSDTLWGLDRVFTMKSDEVGTAIATLPEGLHEFIFHPRTLSCPDTQCLLELKTLLSR